MYKTWGGGGARWCEYVGLRNHITAMGFHSTTTPQHHNTTNSQPQLVFFITQACTQTPYRHAAALHAPGPRPPITSTHHTSTHHTSTHHTSTHHTSTHHTSTHHTSTHHTSTHHTRTLHTRSHHPTPPRHHTHLGLLHQPALVRGWPQRLAPKAVAQREGRRQVRLAQALELGQAAQVAGHLRSMAAGRWVPLPAAAPAARAAQQEQRAPALGTS